MISDLIASPWVGLAGILIGVAVAIWTYIRSKRDREPVWAVWSQRLVTNSLAALPGMAISYNGVPVRDLAIANIAIWNAGALTIRSEDVPSSDKLRVGVGDGAMILNARLVAASSGGNRADVVIDVNRKEAHIAFEFMDRGEGTVIEIIHTCATDDVFLKGKVMGAKIRKATLSKEAMSSQRKYLDWPPRFWIETSMGIIALGVILVPMIVLAMSPSPNFVGWRRVFYDVVARPFMTIFFITIAILVAKGIRQSIKDRVPPELLKALGDPVASKGAE